MAFNIEIPAGCGFDCCGCEECADLSLSEASGTGVITFPSFEEEGSPCGGTANAIAGPMDIESSPLGLKLFCEEQEITSGVQWLVEISLVEPAPPGNSAFFLPDIDCTLLAAEDVPVSVVNPTDPDTVYLKLTGVYPGGDPGPTGGGDYNVWVKITASWRGLDCVFYIQATFHCHVTLPP